MRRVFGIVAAVVLAQAALTVSAAATTTQTAHHKATLSGGGEVDMTATLVNGKPTRVTRFTWTNVPMTCTQEKTVIDNDDTVHVKVKNGKFHDSDANVPPHIFIDSYQGQFKGSGSASGTLRSHGKFSTDTNCDTGTVHWTVTKQ